MHRIVVPKLNNNDDSYILEHWFAEDGQRIEVQQDIVAIETSKAAVDLWSEFAGVLQRVLAVGDSCACGDVIAYVFDSEDERDRAAAACPANWWHLATLLR